MNAEVLEQSAAEHFRGFSVDSQLLPTLWPKSNGSFATMMPKTKIRIAWYSHMAPTSTI